METLSPVWAYVESLRDLRNYVYIYSEELDITDVSCIDCAKNNYPDPESASLEIIPKHTFESDEVETQNYCSDCETLLEQDVI